LTGRGIKVIILERDDQIAGRARHGSCRRRRAPRTFDTTAYKGRNVVGRCFNKLKNWRGIATCYERPPAPTSVASPSTAALIWIQISGLQTS
jgi:transposase